MSFSKKLWVAIGILIVLSPLGVILPHLFHAGGAWGEWSGDEVRKITGFVPEGMRRVGEAWKAPLSAYGVPGLGGALGEESLGYVLSAIVGVVFTAAIMYGLTRLLINKDDKDGR